MTTPLERSLDLQHRLDLLGRGCIRMARSLKGLPGGDHVGDQLLRAGTAPAAHYAEARRSASHAEFVHRLSLAARESEETRVWLGFSEELVQAEDSRAQLVALKALAEGVSAQLGKSAQTARGRESTPGRTRSPLKGSRNAQEG